MHHAGSCIYMASKTCTDVRVDTMQGRGWLQSAMFDWVGLDSLTNRCKSVGIEDGGGISDNNMEA